MLKPGIVFTILLVLGFVFFAMPLSAQEKEQPLQKQPQQPPILERLEKLEKELARLQANQVPVGTILAYYGTIAPEGWLLCNGKDIPENKVQECQKLIKHLEKVKFLKEGEKPRVPDLSGRFLKGLEQDKVGETGGGITIGDHILGIANLPKHEHNIKHSHKLGQDHRYMMFVTGDGRVRNTFCDMRCPKPECLQKPPNEPRFFPIEYDWGTGNWVKNFYMDIDHTHNDTDSAISGSAGEKDPKLPHSVSESRPPYMTVNYIIKY